MSLSEFLREIYRLKLGQGYARTARELEDVFMFFLFAEYFGLPNPYKFFFLEILPQLTEEFHYWHKRMGMERSPLEWIRCC